MSQQYADSRKLAARANLHRHTIAETPWFEWVARRLPLTSGAKVLDVGCGPAWFWANVAGNLPDKIDLCLTDASAGMVGEALERCAALPLETVSGHQADAAALPFEEKSFDVVVAMHMLYHLPDPAAGIAEYHRVLKPGGLLAVTTNGANNLHELYALTTVFGGSPIEPVAAVFGFDIAARLLKERFGNVREYRHPATLRISDPKDVFLALTSYPPGEDASEAQLDAFRKAIARAFEENKGTLEVTKEMGLFVSRKEG